MSDTWTATDGLGRTLPTFAEVGGPRTNRVVALFYFLWLGRHGEAGPFDITKILAGRPGLVEQPEHPAWGPLQAPHHWGESVFGYYVAEDEAVLRKHAQMLADAGVDLLVFDVTNQLDYPESWRALCRVFSEIRASGGRTPQIAFLCPFGDPGKVVRALHAGLYAPGVSPELWFRWEGRPLILADPELLGESFHQARRDHPARLEPGHTLGQSFEATRAFRSVGLSAPTWMATNAAATVRLRRGDAAGEIVAEKRFQGVRDNAWLSLDTSAAPPGPGVWYLEMSDPQGSIGWWSTTNDVLRAGESHVDGRPAAGDRVIRVRWADPEADVLREFFTFRKPQPDYFSGPTGPGEWGWLEVFPQHVFTRADGASEEVAVGVAQNAVDGRLSVLSNPASRGRSFHAGREPRPEHQDFLGHNFNEQWERALKLDPPVVFVTGWNEWIAGRFKSPSGFYGDGPVTFVDEFNREFSRDIEPMAGGHGDAYYYQMVANIRRYKGVRPVPRVRSQPVAIDGRFEDWAGVLPEFRDTLGDPVQRHQRGWGAGSGYTNTTGRNDILLAKVSASEEAIFFYVRTREPISPSTDPNWMLLFLDVDGDPRNGWLGFDYVVNRTRAGKGSARLQASQGVGYEWRDHGEVWFKVAGNEMEMAIPRSMIGLRPGSVAIDFKWADNIQQTGDWSDFTLNGDAAPNDRFRFHAQF